MSLKTLAKKMSAQGRGPDDVLVHMSSKELAGLQGLALAAGGSLTINPETGLPEAGFLDSLLPTVLGAAAMFIPGMQPIGAAAIGAATGALQNKQDPLMGALMGGLGAYGGAGLGAGIQGAGVGAAQQAAQAGAAEAASNIATGLPAFDPTAGQMINAGMLDGAANAQSLAGIDATKGFLSKPFTEQVGAGLQAAYNQPSQFIEGMGGTMPALKNVGMAAAPAAYDYLMQPYDAAKEDETEVPRYRYSARDTGGTMAPGGAYTSERQWFSTPTYERVYAEGGDVEKPDVAKGMSGQSADAFRYLMGQSSSAPKAPAAELPVPQVSSLPNTASSSSAPGIESLIKGMMFKGGSAPASQPSGQLYQQVKSGYTFDPATQTYADKYEYQPYTPPAPTTSRSASERGGSGGRYKKGGLVDLQAGGFVVPADVVSALGNGSSGAGLEVLSKRYGAKPIKGKGDGQSDSIPAKIDGKHPAAVARDEAYMTPQQVKKAGGAKKLYAMMDRIREQAHGKSQQQRPVNQRAALT